jgi:hypothetical protein
MRRGLLLAAWQQRLRHAAASRAASAAPGPALGLAPAATPPDRVVAAAATSRPSPPPPRAFSAAAAAAAAQAATASAQPQARPAWQPPPLSPELLARQSLARAQALARRARRATGIEAGGAPTPADANAPPPPPTSPSPSSSAPPIPAPDPDTPTRALLALLQEADAAGEPPLTSQGLYERAVAEWGGDRSAAAAAPADAAAPSSSPSSSSSSSSSSSPRGSGMFSSRRRFKAALAFLKRQAWVRPRPPPSRGGRGAYVLALTDEGRAQRVGAGEVPPSRFWREALREVARREVAAMAAAGGGL